MKKLLMALVLFVAACSGPKGDEFKVGSYKLAEPANDTPVVLNFFDDGRFSGKIVNNMMGNYTLKADSGIVFSPVATTMMMGPQKAMQVEQNFLQTLPKVTTYQMDGNSLVLITDDGTKMVFEPYSSNISND